MDNNANNDIACEARFGFVLTKDSNTYLHLLQLISSLGPRLCERIMYGISVRHKYLGRGSSAARHCVVSSKNLRVLWLSPLASEYPVTAGKASSVETNHLSNSSKPAHPGLMFEIALP